MDRREFLNYSGEAVLGLSLLGSSKLSLGYAESTAPKVRLGVIGIGMRGKTFLKGAMSAFKDKLEIVAVCDIIPDRVEQVSLRDGVQSRPLADSPLLKCVVRRK